MIAPWRNPEVVRHVRAELRPVRGVTAAMVILVIAALASFLARTVGTTAEESWRAVYAGLLGLQFAVIALWCASTCGQAIGRERERQTFDFWRTTRLTPAELVTGMVLGRPIVGYFMVACLFPLAIAAAIAAGVPARAVAGSYVLMISFALFTSLFGVWASMLTTRASSGLATAMIGVIPLAFGTLFTGSPFPALGALGVLPAVGALHGLSGETVARAFGLPIPFWVAALILHVSLGAWLVLMLTRNVKRQHEEIRLLTPWQAIGFAAFLDVLLYACADLDRVPQGELATLMILVDAGIVYAVGYSILTPAERLRGWWRGWLAGRESYLSDGGLAWPWLVITMAVLYAVRLVYFALVGQPRADRTSSLDAVTVALFTFLVFAIRDTLVFQWYLLTRVRQPTMYGVAALVLYYAGSALVLAISGGPDGLVMPVLLTPVASLARQGDVPGALYVGLAFQMALIGALLVAIHARLGRGDKLAAS